MNRFALVFLFVTLFAGCRPEYSTPNPYTWHKKDAAFFGKFVNPQAIPSTVDRNAFVKLVNTEYPLELSLFGNQKFYYYLENLGDGTGEWKFESGQLYLTAERKLFVMQMGIHAMNPETDEIGIDFVDRFGTKFLILDVVSPAGKK